MTGRNYRGANPDGKVFSIYILEDLPHFKKQREMAKTRTLILTVYQESRITWLSHFWNQH